jgi:predicted metal-dependent phosphoesterase TrpH
LGYSIRLDDAALIQTLEKLQHARKNRNPTIISRLNDLGIQLTLDEIRREVGDGQLGRPHIAQAMVKKGVVASIDEAFDRFLAAGRPAYVDKYRIDCLKAIEIILSAGGVPVLAHPGLLDLAHGDQFDNLITGLKQMGIQGVEVYYSEHTPEQTRLFAELAQRHKLLMTGGSDFHGAIQPEIEMGSGKGNLHVPYELYEKLTRS